MLKSGEMLRGASNRAEPTGLSETVKSLVADGPILLFDGECGVCAASVKWVLSRESSTLARLSGPRVRFAALQSVTGAVIREQLGVPADVDSVIWVKLDESGVAQARWYSAAVVELLLYLGGIFRYTALLRFIPTGLRDGAYRLFAKHRLKFVSPSCLVPTPSERARFLAS
jgi:predicted DCC family thiol-disulfide oxidoreductase YuxK